MTAGRTARLISEKERFRAKRIQQGEAQKKQNIADKEGICEDPATSQPPDEDRKQSDHAA